MFPELTNLLPRSSLRALRRRYFVRVATVGVILVILLMIIHGALLVPSYLYAQQEVRLESADLQNISKTLTTSEEQQAQARLTTLQSKASYLLNLRTAPTASAAIRAVLAVPHGGVTLTGFTFTPPTKAVKGSMQVSGIASTRDTLRSYSQSLGALPGITTADLPISVYANENAIPFTITLAGSFTP
ncbi:hypothetical protein H0X32_02220 [Patescibacteria group bacterium]|nr:hypothetical protein [Patescibacteria group bacterium]